jgi:hypothetical protein
MLSRPIVVCNVTDCAACTSKKGHYEVYKARCDKLRIEVNERAVPKMVAAQGYAFFACLDHRRT